jgi:tetratricopeptide (TPR) repeat protein
VLGALLLLALTPGLRAQEPGSSSSNPGTSHPADDNQVNPATRPRVAQIEAGGAAVTLETSEQLFYMGAALNACGYDEGLDKSAPVRAEVRADMNAALAASEAARTSRDALCAYISEHHQNDPGLNAGQYVSLVLYLSPLPELTPNVDLSELPPQAAAVVNVLPLLRTFAGDIDLHLMWLRHRAEYEALAARVHDPMEHMILNTNIYLHQPVSSYDGRRFLVLLEPMLSPDLTSARIYGSDYIIVTSPDNSAGDPVRMNEIRHIYLHYVVEPMVYSRGAAMERIQPLLRGVQSAPLEFFYKSDVVSLLTECLIKAIEAHMYEIDGPKPKKLNSKDRVDVERYEAEKNLYDRETDLARLKLIDSDEAQGWVMTGYFYQAMTQMEHNGDGLRDEIAPMIYGMDVQRELDHARKVLFVKEVPSDPLSPAFKAHPVEGVDLAEMDLFKGDLPAAADLAGKVMEDPKGDHGRAQYVLARIQLIERHPQDAMDEFEEALTLTKDPRTMAWCHIYLGRLYDLELPPERDKAIAEYKTALKVRDSRPDTKNAAESGLAQPFLPPGHTRPAQNSPDADMPFDPTGKAEKDAYKPDGTLVDPTRPVPKPDSPK